jgi:hypothetical protein
MQQIIAREVVDELTASAQEAQVFNALDRAPDEGVGRACLGHVLSVIAVSFPRKPGRG